ncbi:MAG: hypothetical protein JO144_08615, partial [Actinobacteria bacterium]|nr:hypothetical protein [Actinomycetota bacterium]
MVGTARQRPGRFEGSRLAGWWQRRPGLWPSLVPVVALLAGLLAATTAHTARGTDLRSAGRTNL